MGYAARINTTLVHFMTSRRYFTSYRFHSDQTLRMFPSSANTEHREVSELQLSVSDSFGRYWTE
jgi:hypothetical protein